MIEYIPQLIGEGGEKSVYFTKGKDFVVCFYKQPDAGRRQRLHEIVETYNPTLPGQADAEYWKTIYCWPVGIIVKPRLGVVAPAYPRNFVFPPHDDPRACFAGQAKEGGWFVRSKTRALLKAYAPDELGDFRSMLSVVTHIARGIRRLHTAGLAHSDLSHRNVLIDPKSGSAIIIDIDSLVVRGLFPPTVAGTPGFMAPEVITTWHLPCDDPRRCHPSIHTDRHALACLIYQYLFLRDPLNGPKVHDADPYKDEILKYGSAALFVEHPTDHTNRPPQLSPTISDLGPYLEPLFLQTFVEGLHAPQRRATALEWELSLLKTAHLLVPCENPRCEAKYFPCWSKKKEPACPFCRTRRTMPFPLMILLKQGRQGVWVPESELACSPGLPILDAHLAANAGEQCTATAQQPLATVDRRDGQWVLVNHRLAGVRTASGERVLPGQAVTLAAGTRLLLNSEAGSRLADIIIVNP